MSRIHKFVEDLAKARKTPKEIKTMFDTAFEVNNKRSTNGRRKVRTDDFIEAVRVYVEADRRVTMEELAIKFETSINTIFHMLSEDYKMKRVRCAQAFLKLNFELGLVFLEKIMTMDETSVSLFTPESKRGSSQWLSKDSNLPLKFKCRESRKKQMVLSFFDNIGVIFQHYLPMRTSDVMNMFLKKFKEKQPEMAKNDWYFHFDNAPCHTANSTKEFLAKKEIKTSSTSCHEEDARGRGDRRQERPEGVD
ncbi:Uncharacterized protein FKW44_004855 [Caligus rogercresseyi]|uniref:Histone-lysine N-methyltransferase SETMAR n=1 Tax=Caligus rogercresseyi TaxID=217165 RepID=A0A7T8HMF3_CALRO|nr:Uncharacterized protein FKW44_004855 [Caligus rogercresseyi]